MFNRDMKLKGKNIAIITSEMYEDLEVWYPYFRFMEEGAEVAIIGMIDSPVDILSRHCYPLRTDLGIQEANPDEFSAVLVPGGFAPDMLRRSEAVLDFIMNFFYQGKIVAAMDQGLLVLESAGGILKGRAATATPNIAQEIDRQSRDPLGIKWIDQDVVVDGNLITGRTLRALPFFCREVIDSLSIASQPMVSSGVRAL